MIAVSVSRPSISVMKVLNDMRAAGVLLSMREAETAALGIGRWHGKLILYV